MELRRAILLFAVVLAIAAVVTVLSGGTHRDTDPAPAPLIGSAGAPTAAPGPQAGPTTIAIDADRAPATKSLPASQPATVQVSSDEPGTVTIPALGLTAEAEAGTPARLDVLADPVATTLPVRFTPAGEDVTRTVARLRVHLRAASD